MDAIYEFLIEWGYVGMFVSSFVAGSVFPFSSEAVMLGLLATGRFDTVTMLIVASIGNIGGSMFNYGVGRLGRIEWIEKYLHVKQEKIENTRRFMEKYGAWMGVLCFIPILGSAIAVGLGYFRANPWISLLSISIGKFGRYVILALPFM